NMGPTNTMPGIVNGGVLATSVAGVQVTFDGVAVPLLSVSAGEIDLMAPFELAGKTTTAVQVQYNGVKSNAVHVGIAGPINFFGLVSGLPIQLLAIFNEDFTHNSKSNPARAGSEMILYVSGVGQSVPPSLDGQVNASPLAAAPSPVRILVNGGSLAIPFAGAAPGLAAGIFQINFIAPQAGVSFLDFTVGQARSTFSVVVQ
ncbi:MAG TPA: hypothetical protein VGV35_09630, partial [Bryobacteraceae bacterium]|nr:hypothetical protein [Bryobacteraceae bacterium]